MNLKKMKKLKTKFILWQFWITGILFDAVLSLCRGQSWYSLRKQSMELYDYVNSVYKVGYAVEVLRNLSATEFTDVLNTMNNEYKNLIDAVKLYKSTN